MPAMLRIRWDGTLPGLDQHLIDLGAFHEPLARLNKALRRIASGLIRDAFDEEYGARGGRLQKDARSLVVYLRQVHAGCAEPEFVIDIKPTGAPVQLDLFGDLPQRTVARFVEAVGAEARGEPVLAVVRSYLDALPDLISTQRYIAYDADDKEVCRAEFSSVSSRPEAPPARPRLVRGVGQVAGLTFLAGPEVKLSVEGGIETFEATQALVEQAMRSPSRVSEPRPGPGMSLGLGRRERPPSARSPIRASRTPTPARRAGPRAEPRASDP